MSPKSAKPTTTKPASKHAVPIVNVFDEDQSATSMQPARRPVVVEIEDVPTQEPMESPTLPAFMAQPETPPQPVAAPEPTVSRVWPSQQQQQYVQPEAAPQPVMPMQAPMAMPDISNVSPVPMSQPAEQVPYTQPTPAPVPQSMGMSAEPTLPSFFEHDLKNGMNQPMQSQPAMQGAVPGSTPNMFADASAVSPQAVVGEINDAAGEGGSNKKLIGIILMVLAVLILAIGGLFLYARNLFSPTSVPTPSPEVVATPRPTPVSTPTPVASASATPLPASESAALKKKVKVDVLNGTKIAGLATKQAAVIKAAGFVTGTVGNGDAADAGTIVVAPTYKALVIEIQNALKEFTFKVTEDAKATSITVTLGEAK